MNNLTNKLAQPTAPSDGSPRDTAQHTYIWTGELLQSKAVEVYLAPRLKAMARKLADSVLAQEGLTAEVREQMRQQYLFLTNEIIPLIQTDHAVAKAAIDRMARESPPKLDK